MNGELVRQIVTELGTSQVHWLLWVSVKWAVLGVVLGLVAGLLSIRLSKRLGWYESGWRYAGWIRWPLWVFCVVLCGAMAGAAGFCKGLIQGTERVLRHSQLVTKVFPEVGDAFADVMGGFQLSLSLSNSLGVTDSNFLARIDDFRAGKWELNAPSFNRQLDEAQVNVVSNIVSGIESNIVARSPKLQSSLPNSILHHALGYCWKWIVELKVRSGLKDHKLDTAHQTIRTRLVAEAQREGDPETISHQQLSAFLVSEAIIPSIMVPVRIFLGQNVTMFLVFTVLSMIVPALVFRFTCGLVKMRPGQTQEPASIS